MDPLIFLLLLTGLVGTTSATTTNMTTAPVNMTSPPVNMTSPPVNMTSPPVNMTSPPANMTSPPANMTSPPKAKEPKMYLEFKLQQNFTTQLTNKSSPEFKQLEDKVTTALDMVYSEKYGADFNRTVINSFSRGSVVVDAELIFNNASSAPDTSAVENALVEAVSNSSNFSLAVNPSSIAATKISTSAAAPTSVPTMPGTSAAANATSPSATTPATTASTDAPSSSEGTLGLEFSLNQTFTSDLSNSSSAAYQTLAATVVKEVNKVCENLYGSDFSRSIVNKFTSGSVKVDMTMVFKNKDSVPSASSATSQLSSALTSNSSSLNIVSGSISAQSTSTSSSPPWPTTGSLAVFSLTLLAVAQMLSDL